MAIGKLVLLWGYSIILAVRSYCPVESNLEREREKERLYCTIVTKNDGRLFFAFSALFSPRGLVSNWYRNLKISSTDCSFQDDTYIYKLCVYIFRSKYVYNLTTAVYLCHWSACIFSKDCSWYFVFISQERLRFQS